MFAIVYDFGSSNLKACLFEVGSRIRAVATANAAYGLYTLEKGGVEQDAELQHVKTEAGHTVTAKHVRAWPSARR